MFTKLISFIISVIISLAGIIPGMGQFPETRDVAFARVLDCDYGNVLENDGEWKIFRNQGQFERFFEGVKDCPAKEYADDLDDELFKNYNVVIINVVLPGSLDNVHVKHAEENGTTLRLQYITSTQTSLVGTSALENSLIFVLTSKFVFDVELENAGRVELPFAISDSFGKLYNVIEADIREYDEKFCEEIHVFSNYGEWSDFLMNGNWNLKNYETMATESFFENNNLVLIVARLASPHHSLRVGEWYTEENVLHLKYWDVCEPILAPAVEIEEAILFAVNKNVDSVSAERSECDLDFILDGSYITW